MFFPACRAQLDLGFLIDGSGSIESSGKGNFGRCINFIKSLVASFKISNSYTRVGVILYSSRSRLIFGFGRHSTLDKVLRAIDRIRYPNGGTNTGYALSYARKYLFRRKRSRSKQVLIVMTDGKSRDRLSRPARRLKRQGIVIYSLGVGKRYNFKQLRQMASSKRNVYTSGFRSLQSLVRVIKEKACKGRVSSNFEEKCEKMCNLLTIWTFDERI